MFEPFTEEFATPELLATIGAPLCHRAQVANPPNKVADVVSFRRLVDPEGGPWAAVHPGLVAYLDVLILHGQRGDADGIAYVHQHRDSAVRTGVFRQEPGEDLGVVEVDAEHGQPKALVLRLPA